MINYCSLRVSSSHLMARSHRHVVWSNVQVERDLLVAIKQLLIFGATQAQIDDVLIVPRRQDWLYCRRLLVQRLSLTKVYDVALGRDFGRNLMHG